MKPTEKTIFIFLIMAVLIAIPAETLAGTPWGWAGDRLKDLGGALKGIAEFALDPLGWAIDKIANAILNAFIAFVFGTILAVTGTVFLLAAGLLQFILSPDFLGMHITSSDYSVVYEMWKMVRDFANMGFVLAMVAIGLGTALRYGEYQLQRALPRLIIIALLINFTPVIVGFFIDAANVVIHFLVSETVGNNLWQMAEKAYDAIGELFSLDIFTRSPVKTLAASVATMFFHIIGTIVFILFFFLYLFRFVALIILFILSPLAFFSFVLPATRGLWNMWWKQFISWLTVGISGAFFILLASQMTADMFDLNVETASNPFGAFFSTFITAAVPIAFLVMGFMFTLQTSAMGAQIAIAMGQRTYRWAGRAGAEVARGTPAFQRVESAARRRLETAPLIGGAFGGPGAYEAKLTQERGTVRGRLEHMPVESLRQRIERTPMTRTARLERAAALEVLAERNQLRESERPYLREAQTWGVNVSRILEKMPHWAGDVAPAGTTPEQAVRQRILDMESEDFRKNIRAHVFAPPPPGSAPDTLARQIDVLAGMDLQKAIDMGRRGRKSTRTAMHDFVAARQNEILAEITNLQNQGRTDEANRLRDVVHHILNSPNYQP